MGNFDFSKCYECQYCYEAKEEKSSELYKKDETEYNTISANQNLREKPELESLPKDSTTGREKYKEIKENASLTQENQNINVNNNNNNNINNNKDIKRSDGDFDEDSSFINDENSKKNSNDINNDNIDEKEEKKISENMDELKRNENEEERESRERENQIQDWGNKTNKEEI